jgi:hypothetical protein
VRLPLVLSELAAAAVTAFCWHVWPRRHRSPPAAATSGPEPMALMNQPVDHCWLCA